MTDLYRQAIVLSTLPVTGWYRYKDIFQIIPPTDAVKRPSITSAHHPLIFQWRYPASKEQRTISGNFEVPQWLLDKENSAEKARELLLALGVFLTARIFEYRGKQSWFVDLENAGSETLEPKWGQELYTAQNFQSPIESLSSVVEIQKIEEIESNQYFNRRFIEYDAVFDVPQNLNFLLDRFFNLSANDKNSFLSSCALFEQGMEVWSTSPSLSFVGFVSCLETLINAEHKDAAVEKCSECGQDRHRVTKKFRDFFLAYGDDSQEFKKYAMKIYKYRSKVVHTGELFNGEVIPEKFGSDGRIHDNDFRRGVIRTCRICMVNWMLARTNG